MFHIVLLQSLDFKTKNSFENDVWIKKCKKKNHNYPEIEWHWEYKTPPPRGSGFTAEIERRREIFQLEAYKLIKGEKTTQDDYIELEQYRYKLGLGHRDARLIMEEIEQSSRFKPLIQCPHCHTYFILKK